MRNVREERKHVLLYSHFVQWISPSFLEKKTKYTCVVRANILILSKPKSMCVKKIKASDDGYFSRI